MVPRLQLGRLVSRSSKYGSPVDKETISRSKAVLEHRVEVFYTSTNIIIGGYLSVLGRSPPDFTSKSGDHVWTWLIPLPSRLNATDRAALSFLIDVEVRLREGAAYEAVRMAILMADSLHKFASDKAAHGEEIAERIASMVGGHGTKSTCTARQLEWERNCAIADFNAQMGALRNCGRLENSKLQGLPEMTKEDTYRKKGPYSSRLPGDSHVHEEPGHLRWRAMATQKLGKGGGREGRLNEERGEKRLEKRMIDEVVGPFDRPGI